MKTVTEHLRSRLLAKVHDSPVGKSVNAHRLKETQWCPEFEQLMRNRLLLGSFRYGSLQRQRLQQYKNIDSAITRLNLYQETGNLEHLVDAANLCLVEYVAGEHPNRHFEATDDGIHVEKR